MTLSITIFDLLPSLVWDICPSVVGHAPVTHNVSMFISLVVCATASIVTGPTPDSWIYDGISLAGGRQDWKWCTEICVEALLLPGLGLGAAKHFLFSFYRRRR